MVYHQGTFIGFTGAGGTGKTTTAKALLECLPKYSFLPSASREVFKRFKLEKESDQDGMSEILRWKLQQEIQIAHRATQIENYNRLMICDRTQLDQYCYATIQCSKVLQPDDLEFLDTLLRDSLPQYRRIFYFPLHTYAPLDDGMRDDREGLRVHFDLLLRGLFEKYRVFPVTVPIGSVEKRCDFILRHISHK